MNTIKGYVRENGAVGVRNHVLVLPLDDLSNSAAIGVSKLIRGTTVIPHPYGRLQFGRDLDLFIHILSGTGANPNVAGTIVIRNGSGSERKKQNRGRHFFVNH